MTSTDTPPEDPNESKDPWNKENKSKFETCVPLPATRPIVPLLTSAAANPRANSTTHVKKPPSEATDAYIETMATSPCAENTFSAYDDIRVDEPRLTRTGHIATASRLG